MNAVFTDNDGQVLTQRHPNPFYSDEIKKIYDNAPESVQHQMYNYTGILLSASLDRRFRRMVNLNVFGDREEINIFDQSILSQVLLATRSVFLWDSFFQANRHIRFARPGRTFELQWLSHSYRERQPKDEHPYDHNRDVRCYVPNQKLPPKELRPSQKPTNRFLITHPYGHIGMDTLSEDGVSWRDGGKGRSWYYPDNTHLILLGIAEVIEQVNLDYSVPKMEDIISHQNALVGMA